MSRIPGPMILKHFQDTRKQEDLEYSNHQRCHILWSDLSDHRVNQIGPSIVDSTSEFFNYNFIYVIFQVHVMSMYGTYTHFPIGLFVNSSDWSTIGGPIYWPHGSDRSDHNHSMTTLHLLVTLFLLCQQILSGSMLFNFAVPKDTFHDM